MWARASSLAAAFQGGQQPTLVEPGPPDPQPGLLVLQRRVDQVQDVQQLVGDPVRPGDLAPLRGPVRLLHAPGLGRRRSSVAMTSPFSPGAITVMSSQSIVVRRSGLTTSMPASVATSRGCSPNRQAYASASTVSTISRAGIHGDPSLR